MRQWNRDRYRRRDLTIKFRHGDPDAGPRKPKAPVDLDVEQTREDDIFEDPWLDPHE